MKRPKLPDGFPEPDYGEKGFLPRHACEHCGKVYDMSKTGADADTNLKNYDYHGYSFCCKKCMYQYAEENDVVCRKVWYFGRWEYRFDMKKKRHPDGFPVEVDQKYKNERSFFCETCGRHFNLPDTSGDFTITTTGGSNEVHFYQFCSEDCIKNFAKENGLILNKNRTFSLKGTNENMTEKRKPDLPKGAPDLTNFVEMRLPVDKIAQHQIRERSDDSAIVEFERMFRAACDDDNVKNDPNSDFNIMTAAGFQNILVVTGATRQPGIYTIVDGHHRFKAAVNVGWKFLTVNVLQLHPRTLDDLEFIQACTNTEYVVNRSAETKRRQVQAALHMKPEWTNLDISRYCNVSDDLVASVRQQMEMNGLIPKKETDIQKAKKAVEKPENQKKSSRELAKELDVDEKTVRKARKDSEAKKSAPEPPESSAIEENLNKVSEKAKASMEENQEQQQNAPWENLGHIPLTNEKNMDMIVRDVIRWLGDRLDTFRILFDDRCNEMNENK